MDKPVYKCDSVEYTPDPGLSFRAVEQEVSTLFFKDLGGYEDRMVRVLANPSAICWLLATRPDAMREGLMVACEQMAWLATIPEQALLDRFPDAAAAIRCHKILEDMMDLPCGDEEGLEQASYALESAWSDFLVGTVKPVFEGDVYHQLLWIRSVNKFEDFIGRDCRPLDRIGTGHLRSYMAASRDRIREEIFTSRDGAADLSAHRALKDVEGLYDHCLRSFNSAALSAVHPGTLHAVIEALTANNSLCAGPVSGPHLP
jgi:hypothetical protein